MKRFKFPLCLLVVLGFLQRAVAQDSNALLAAKQYSVFADSIVQQHKFITKALSDRELLSNYQSPANLYQSRKISFKFSINGKDNEMKSGVDDYYYCTAATNVTPLIKFGTPLKDTDNGPEGYLKPDTKLTIRLDMRDVFADFRSKGFYVTFNGDKIFKEDFKAVYVAGGTVPLIWDFDNLVNHRELQLQDADGDGIFETTLILNAQQDKQLTASKWKLTRDISAFPQYHSEYPLADALYNMSLEEMINAVEPDSTFRTGKLWAGVWTRDISYSIILSMAYLQPRVAMKSLLRKVNKKNKIIQDTGTGGAYPVSTDRMIWAAAAWELYKATGDKDWLQQAYLIIKNSVGDDLLNIYDRETGLVRGESSFLDWREQTYPKWMQPADIFESECLGTNAVHYQANIVLSGMATILHQPAEAKKYKAIAGRIKAGINRYLWLEGKGYYAQYLYGRNFKIVSPRSEALGEALCILFGIADKRQRQLMVEKAPVTPFGISCIFPQIPGIPPYHNNAVWPFVESYWALAAAKAGNEPSVMESIGSVYRPAALFLTNKENFVAENGDFAGTQINSGNMLWSLAGNISLIHKIIFGIEFLPDGLAMHPFVPEPLKGRRSLMNFKYRKSVLDISVEGYGNRIRSFFLDGKLVSTPVIPGTITGRHSIRIILANNEFPAETINKVNNYTTLPAPEPRYTSKTLDWQAVDNAAGYIVLKNGKTYLRVGGTEKRLRIPTTGYAEWQVMTVDSKGIPSFASEPLVTNTGAGRLYEMEDYVRKADLPYKGYSGSGFIRISKSENREIEIPVDIKDTGIYAIDFHYANGNGPTNTSNKCAIRTLKEGNDHLGTIVLPQRGNEEWSNWGFSNAVKVRLTKGRHILRLVLEPQNENMNGEINEAALDYLRTVKIN
jgi:hypothetical protein